MFKCGMYKLALGLSLALGFSSVASANVFSDFFNNLFGQDNVSVVKEAVLPQYSSTRTLGDAFDHYLDCKANTLNWRSFSENGYDLVEFSCSLEKSPKLIAENKDNPLLLGLVGAINLFTGRDFPDLDVDKMQEYFKIKDLNLKVQFAMSKADSQSFALKEIFLISSFADGAKGKIALDEKSYSKIFKDSAIADFEAPEDYASFVEKLVKAHDSSETSDLKKDNLI